MLIKVCHITSAHDSTDGRIFDKECVTLSNDDRFDVVLVAPGMCRTEKKVKVIGIGERPSSRFKRMFLFTKKAYKTAMEVDADIYHFHDPELLSVGLKLKKKGKLVIYDSHENTVEQIRIKKYLPAWIRNVVAQVYSLWEKYVCKKIDTVIFPCLVNGENPFKDRCRETVFLDNFPYLAEFSNIKKEKPVYDLCVIGSLTEERGITKLLQACKIAKAKVALAGNFSPAEYEEELRNGGLFENVEYLGPCNRGQVLEIYSKSKLGASTILPVGQYPSIYNLPTKVYECMAMCLPVIISNFPFPKEVMKTYPFGICVDPTDSDAIAENIIKLLGDPQLCVDMGKMGRKAIEEKFNWEKESQKLIQLYLRLYADWK